MLKNSLGKTVEDSSDRELVLEIKENNNADALNELCARHTGLYIQILHQYSGRQPQQFFNDLVDEKLCNVYNAAISFDENKGMSFHTYLGETVKWRCFAENTRSKKMPTDDYSEESLEKEGSNYQNPLDSLMGKETYSNLISFASNYEDKRILKILEKRFFDTKTLKNPTWKEVGKELKITYERARQIYEKFIRDFKKQYAI